MSDGPTLHPELTPEERRRLFLRGIELFNAGEHYECHEAFEEIWRSTTPQPRDLFQGLIQVAVGLHHHLRRGRPGPARRVLARGLARLRPLAPASHGLDLAALLRAGDAWERWLAEPAGEPPAVPRIVVLDEQAVR